MAGSAILTEEIINGVRKELMDAIIRADNLVVLSFKKFILLNQFVFHFVYGQLGFHNIIYQSIIYIYLKIFRRYYLSPIKHPEIIYQFYRIALVDMPHNVVYVKF
jgi:hypothetical protein